MARQKFKKGSLLISDFIKSVGDQSALLVKLIPGSIDSDLLEIDDSALDTKLAAMEADVAQNESDADAAIAAVQADVDQNESDADAAIAANEVHIDNMATLTGVAKDSVHLSTFTGSTIADNQTAKAALQALETAVEAEAVAARAAEAANEVHIDNVVALSGVAKDAVNLGSFTGSTISDNRNVKAALQDLETELDTVDAAIATAIDALIDSAPGALDTLNELAAAIGDDADYAATVTAAIASEATTARAAEAANAALAAANEVHIDNAATLSGVAKDAVNLGAFSGAVIADNQTLKAALQALETKDEAQDTSLAAELVNRKADDAELDADIGAVASAAKVMHRKTARGEYLYEISGIIKSGGQGSQSIANSLDEVIGGVTYTAGKVLDITFSAGGAARFNADGNAPNPGFLSGGFEVYLDGQRMAKGIDYESGSPSGLDLGTVADPITKLIFNVFTPDEESVLTVKGVKPTLVTDAILTFPNATYSAS